MVSLRKSALNAKHSSLYGNADKLPSLRSQESIADGLRTSAVSAAITVPLSRSSSSARAPGNLANAYALCREATEGTGIDAPAAKTDSMQRQSLKAVLKAPNNLLGLRAMLCDKFSILLVFYPAGIAASFLEWDDLAIFWFNFIAMVPLAKIMGDATEELAAGLRSDTIGGLLNATFGNAVEVLLTIFSLRHGLLDVVKATLLGSCLSNMLLVLGMSFFLGGLQPVNGSIKLREQNFEAQGALVNITMLLVACMSIVLPTVFMGSFNMNSDSVLMVSRLVAILVLTSYCAFLVFQLYTHIALFDSPDDDDEESAALTVPCSLALLCVSSVLVAISSELLVGSIDGTVERSGMPQQFIGIILLPIIGNACEHLSAVRFAIQDRPALSIGIAVGSSTQIALFVVPFSVIIGWFLDRPLDLDFHPLNTCVLLMAVLIVFSIVLDGKTHWLEGYMLCIAYAIISVLYLFLPEGHSDLA